ncbi:MAG: TIGR04150 pseudo-rSAM protein [Prevotellaceae bacterium]|jgi:pseudo-rSAM protein|nr:TIGR04150 pseudo-rSAM protein [Prevotellaceae bacterium]
MNENNWLYIEPFVYICVNTQKALLYNTLNGKLIECLRGTKTYLLIKQLNDDKNLLVIKLPSNYQKNKEISGFVKNIREFYCGDVLTLPENATKPFQLKPIFNIQHDLKIMKESESVSVGTKIMQKLTSITIQINSICDLTCCDCCNYNRQFLFCTKKTSEELHLKLIKKILDNLGGSYIKAINVIGGNVFKYSKFDEFINILKVSNIVASFFIHYQNIIKCDKFINSLSNNEFSVNILVNFPIDIDKLKSAKHLLENNNINIKYIFIVESEKNCIFVENLINEMKIENNFTLLPFYNEKNLSFFCDNIFPERNDILDAKPEISNIYARQVINSNYYGKLMIMSSGDVFANLNEKKLGNINSGTLHEFAYKEMKSGNSWRKTRKNVKPCNQCIYKYLCPSISNYEYAIGKFNLCNII